MIFKYVYPLHVVVFGLVWFEMLLVVCLLYSSMLVTFNVCWLLSLRPPLVGHFVAWLSEQTHFLFSILGTISLGYKLIIHFVSDLFMPAFFVVLSSPVCVLPSPFQIVYS